jgi:hypothetical protein
MPHKDYSGTPLYKKLGIKEGGRLGLAGLEVEEFLAMVGELPAGVEISDVASSALDVLVMFATGERQMKRRFKPLTRLIHPNGAFWIAYPKKSSSIETDLTFDIVQHLGLDAGLVDNKTCAINDDWSGVRFVVRLKDRPKATKETNEIPKSKAAMTGTSKTK